MGYFNFFYLRKTFSPHFKQAEKVVSGSDRPKSYKNR